MTDTAGAETDKEPGSSDWRSEVTDLGAGDCLCGATGSDCPLISPHPNLTFLTPSPPFVFHMLSFSPLSLSLSHTHTHSLYYCLINTIAICSICNSPIREMLFDPTCPDLIWKSPAIPTHFSFLTHTHIWSQCSLSYPDFDLSLLSLYRTWADLSALCRFGFHPPPQVSSGYQLTMVVWTEETQGESLERCVFTLTQQGKRAAETDRSKEGKPI